MAFFNEQEARLVFRCQKLLNFVLFNSMLLPELLDGFFKLYQFG